MESAGFDPPPAAALDDPAVMAVRRRPQPGLYTTINRYGDPADPRTVRYTKVNCLHCLDPACASACLVGALRPQADGAVTYDADKCMGCRYCMVACPFQIPTYDYDNATTPQVRKCNLCAHNVPRIWQVPACVKICPEDALIYGQRPELLELARHKIRTQPDLYVDHIYGEHEAGGTNWLYLSSVPFESLDFLNIGPVPPPHLTEALQHGVFKFFIPPLAAAALLGMLMRLTRADDAAAGDEARPTGPPLPAEGGRP